MFLDRKNSNIISVCLWRKKGLKSQFNLNFKNLKSKQGAKNAQIRQ